MAFVPGLIAGLSGLGGLLANRPQTTKQTATSTDTSTEAPNLDPKLLSYRNSIINNFLQMLQPGNLDLSGYQANAIEGINNSRELQKQKLRESLAARGIFGPAAESAINGVDNSRFGDIIQLKNSIPLLRQQMMSDIVGRAGQFFGSVPFGRTITDNRNSTTIGTSPGNMLAGGIGGGASALAYLYGQGAFNQKNPYANTAVNNSGLFD